MLNMSALLRQLLTEAIERRQVAALTPDPLFDIIGIGDGPNDGITSENLDQFLYQVNQPKRPAPILAEGSTAPETDEQAEPNYR